MSVPAPRDMICLASFGFVVAKKRSTRASIAVVRVYVPLLMIGRRRVAGPGGACTKSRANGSARYPSSTALKREMAASVSVPWIVVSWLGPEPDAGIPLRLGPPRPRPRPRPLAPRKERRLGIDGADILKLYSEILKLEKTLI